MNFIWSSSTNQSKCHLEDDLVLYVNLTQTYMRILTLRSFGFEWWKINIILVFTASLIVQVFGVQFLVFGTTSKAI